ncbi:E3 ubiquitin-protein ligase MARCHF8-like [Impatiens glandulifera]|uniref:E3 ubiquitin-protein ligase MARCHF8-like n=1 Tax=Impatiens glandulifera TaxID=253017 RepID=UPI001FB11F66|nr:E3 ubiquitin-protein ligase MARCHF8-like [Impatiens glandulifera]
MKPQESPFRCIPVDPTANQMTSNQVLDSSSSYLICQDLLKVRSVSSASHSLCGNPNHINPIQIKEDEKVGEEISKEEESVCRICFGVCEEGNTLRMGCSCKGALRLVHEECLVKWFNMKGNRMCDVCGKEVSNLTMNLLQQPIHNRRNNAHETNQQYLYSRKMSAWQEFMLIFISSTMWYFFFLELLMIHDMQAKVIIVAAPFSVVLGLLASILAVSLAIKEYIWKYTILEWGFVAIILLYLYYVLNVEVVYVITLSSAMGFGIVIGLNFLYIQYSTSLFDVTENYFPA